MPRHDLHHVLAGYETDWAGEMEMSAWEVASGCGRYWFAWMLNLGGLAFGLVRWPRRTWRAFRRGRACKNLYDGRAVDDALLDTPLEEVRTTLEIVT